MAAGAEGIRGRLRGGPRRGPAHHPAARDRGNLSSLFFWGSPRLFHLPGDDDAAGPACYNARDLGPSWPREIQEPAMDDTVRRITAEDINPRFNWGRALPALGTMGVDFEERVDYRRLHKYRLSRARMALEKSDLGALLLFDVNNIRYLTSTKIGEWERDKLSRWALLTR